jgi:hypothetical protein
MMASGYAIAAALLGLLIAVVHSSFAKSYGISALYPDNAEKRRIIMLIWHLPSLTWAALALAILMARLMNVANLPLTLGTIFVFSVSGICNLWAHKRADVGGVLLLVTASMISLDWLSNL